MNKITHLISCTISTKRKKKKKKTKQNKKEEKKKRETLEKCFVFLLDSYKAQALDCRVKFERARAS